VTDCLHVFNMYMNWQFSFVKCYFYMNTWWRWAHQMSKHVGLIKRYSNVKYLEKIECILLDWMLSDLISDNARYERNKNKNTNHQQMPKESFIINRNTLLHVSTLLGHLQGELFCYRYTKVALYSWVRMCFWLCTALFLEAWTLCEYTVHSQQHILTQL
jgi:hypothetical protein